MDVRPSLRQLVGRAAVVTAVNAAALVVLAALLPGLTVDGAAAALMAGACVGVVGLVVWPALGAVIVPISVLTLGLGAIALDAAVVGLILDRIPGVDVDGGWTTLATAVGLAALTAGITALLGIDDDGWVDRRMAGRAQGRRRRTDQAGIVFIQIDGLSEPVLRRALASGDAPTLRQCIESGATGCGPGTPSGPARRA